MRGGEEIGRCGLEHGAYTVLDVDEEVVDEPLDIVLSVRRREGA